MTDIAGKICSYIDLALLGIFESRITKKEKIHLEHPADPSHGDYATNVAMALFKAGKSEYAKNKKLRKYFDKWKSPVDLASQITAELNKLTKTDKSIERIELANSFINFYLSQNFFLTQASQVVLNGKAEISQVSNGKKVSLEHTQVNPNKSPHVGHLRNACIGDSLLRILRGVGYNVKVQYYQNDIGLQVASIVLAYKKEFVKKSKNELFTKWAAKAYADIENQIEKNPDLLKEREKIQKSISERSSSNAKSARKITDKILFEILKLFKNLGIQYDLVVRESDIAKNKLWESTYNLLKKNGAFYQADSGDKKGCWLLKVPNEEDKIIVRSNGIPTYTGNDIAYHLWKFGVINDFSYSKIDISGYGKPIYMTDTDKGGRIERFSNAEMVVNIIDTTQTYPQNVVKESLGILGYSGFSSNYRHVNYGFVYLSQKTVKKLNLISDKKIVKISGRKGTVVSIIDFIELLREGIIKVYGKSDAVEKVSVGAAKFEMLKYNTYQDVVFDIDNALDLKGFSSVYLQYACVRAKSVCKKAKYDKPSSKFLQVELSKEEGEILKKIYLFDEIVVRAAGSFAPHHICSYLFELAQLFNKFYNSHLIIGSENAPTRLMLTKSTAIVIEQGLELLGISVPDMM